MLLEKVFHRVNKILKKHSGHGMDWGDFIETLPTSFDMLYDINNHLFDVVVKVVGGTNFGLVHGGEDDQYTHRIVDYTLTLPQNTRVVGLRNRIINSVVVDGLEIELLRTGEINPAEVPLVYPENTKYSQVYVDNRQIVLPFELGKYTILVDYIPDLEFEELPDPKRLAVPLTNKTGAILAEHLAGLELLERGIEQQGSIFIERATHRAKAQRKITESGSMSIKSYWVI